MHGLPIDDGSVDRLLSGAVSPEDAPPGYAGVAEVLRSAGGPTVAAERWREQEIVTRAARCIAETTDPHEMRGSSMRSSLLPFKVIAASAVGVLGLAGAAAAIGVNLASHHTRLDSGTSVVTPTTLAT